VCKKQIQEEKKNKSVRKKESEMQNRDSRGVIKFLKKHGQCSESVHILRASKENFVNLQL